MFTNLRNDRYGSLLFFEGRNRSDDPFKNYMVLKRRGVEEVCGVVRFSAPEDKNPVKVSRFMFNATLDVPSNFVPYNDWHSKSVGAFHVRILDNVVDSTANALEYYYASFYAKHLNFSVDAKEVELFPSGTYDSRDLNGSDLKFHTVKHNGKGIVENRQSYAEEVWSAASSKIKLVTGGADIAYETLKHRYTVRAPIAHGLCRQPRVLPTGSRLQFEIRLAAWNQVIQKHDDYRICRADKTAVEEAKYKWPIDDRILTEKVTIKHYFPAKCNCAVLLAAYTDANFKVEQILEGNDLTPVAAGSEHNLFDKTKADGEWENFQSHKVTISIPKIREMKVVVNGEETTMATFWLKNDKGQSDELDKLDLTKHVELKDHLLEAVYCVPGKPEKPFPVKGGGARIPFLSPKLVVINKSAGQRSYDIELSDGPFPHMVILSGMSYSRREQIGTEICGTRTSMFEPGFEIEELIIYINNREAFRSPWHRPIDHYLNYLKSIGRYHNKAIGGSVDFWKFQNENWCVPLRFDDRSDRRGLVTAKITFRKELTKSWDAFVTRIPVEDLILDRAKNSKWIMLYCICHLTLSFPGS